VSEDWEDLFFLRSTALRSANPGWSLNIRTVSTWRLSFLMSIMGIVTVLHAWKPLGLTQSLMPGTVEILLQNNRGSLVEVQKGRPAWVPSSAPIDSL
jgi:hypothetical protein